MSFDDNRSLFVSVEVLNWNGVLHNSAPSLLHSDKHLLRDHAPKSKNSHPRNDRRFHDVSSLLGTNYTVGLREAQVKVCGSEPAV